MGEGFSRRTRRFDADILCVFQGKTTQYGGKRTDQMVVDALCIQVPKKRRFKFMKKRTLSFLLALMMCLSLLPMTALAAGDTLKDVPIPKPAAPNYFMTDVEYELLYFMFLRSKTSYEIYVIILQGSTVFSMPILKIAAS